MKKFSKNIAKEFKHSFGRFLAIMAIIALGVGFLIGISQSTPDMKTSMSDYLQENSAYDIDIKASYGLTDYDIANIAGLTDDVGGQVVAEYMPVVTSSVMASIDGGKESAVNLIGLDFGLTSGASREGNSYSYLNKFTLIEGSFPTEGLTDADGNEIPLSRQVVAERSNNYFETVSVGDKITLASEISTSDSTYGDIYTSSEYIVVGIVSTPDYYYVDAREITTIGTGVVSLVIYGNYLPDDSENSVYDLTKEGIGGLFGIMNVVRGTLMSDSQFTGDVAEDNVVKYTDLWVRITGADNYEYFYSSYKNYVQERMTYIETLGTLICSDINSAINGNAMLASALSDSSWYVLDRANSNMSYVSFDMNVEKVEDIAGIFPVFFIVVAALVALTSMTRMVEQDRLQIGALKALGYKEGTIMAKYLIYCILACIIGVVVGILLGFSIMPTIFWNAYATMYYLPDLYLGFSWWLALAVVFGSLAVTIAVTIIACRTTTKEKPSVLMQPKAPKPGKRILLERVGFLWNRITFKWKATIRNIFRYKKNMILTIISVMGCTALILTGFGLGDSVEAVADLQYSEIIYYDTIVGHVAGQEADPEGELAKYLEGLEDDAYTDVYSENGQLVINSKSYESVDLYLSDGSEEFSDFVSLHNRKSGKDINYSEGGIVVPENIATVYGLSAGDTVTYITADRVALELKIAGVCEYYTGSDIYMDSAAFAKAYAEAAGVSEDAVNIAANTYLIKYGYGSDESAMDADAEKLLSDSAVTSVEFTYTTVRSFDALNETMSFVILILVVSAGALAAIVLYNLTNINIDERRREIATLRVLGYTKREVAGYIYRESSILTIVGALLGLLGGWLLHMYIANRVNSVMMMFGKAIAPLSFLWAFLITIGFAVVVYAFMLIKLYKIDMAESLKSNE